MTVPDSPTVPARVLIVEDEEPLRRTLQEWLQWAGYDTTMAADGAEAIDLVNLHAFDVVVTDLKMPNVDGLELLSLIKDLDPTLQVIFLSGQATVQDAVEAMRGGRGFDFLQKPLDDLTLLNAVINRALSHRAALIAVIEPPPDLDATPPDPVASTTGSPPLLKALAFIESHYRQPINLRDVASALGYTAPYLTDLVRRETGRTVQRWIITHRMTEAKRLLCESDLPVNQIAQDVGYGNVHHFVRQFGRLNGVTPLAWRKTGDRGAAGNPAK